MKKGRRTQKSNGSIAVYSRIKSETIQALDNIRHSMPRLHTRSQLIDAALAEFVQRHSPPSKRKGARSRYADLTKMAKKSAPPQSWFEEDFSSLRRPKG